MKHHLLGGLTVAVAMSVFGAPLPGQAQDTGESQLSIGTQAEHLSRLLNSPETGSSADSDASSLEQAEPESAAMAQPPSESFDIATVFAHPLDDRQAATVYLRSIPVITFVGNELSSLSGTKSAAPANEAGQDPLVRANSVLAQLQRLSTIAEATEIKVRWDEDQKAYIVAWGNEDLIQVDNETMLPDTTQDHADDALQIANRLRRLLGDAPALTKIEGLPEPVAPAAPRVGAVTSTLTGMASWYGPGFHGRRSASGEVFNQNALTAAHRTLPFGTRVRVTNVNTGQQVIVRINDRGPFGHGRVIDLSSAAAANIGLRAAGVGQVRLEVLSAP